MSEKQCWHCGAAMDYETPFEDGTGGTKHFKCGSEWYPGDPPRFNESNDCLRRQLAQMTAQRDAELRKKREGRARLEAYFKGQLAHGKAENEDHIKHEAAVEAENERLWTTLHRLKIACAEVVTVLQAAEAAEETTGE